jgi:hypothetical protein
VGRLVSNHPPLQCLSQAKYNDTDWEDLKFLIAVHREEFLFYGGAPTTPWQFFNKYWMAVGYGMESWIPPHTRRRAEPTRLKNRRYLTQVKGSVAKILSYQYIDQTVLQDGQQECSFSLGAVETILKISISAREGNSKLSQYEQPISYQGHFKKKSRRGRNPAQLSPTQFLDALCVAISSESTILNFDYLAMHKRCMTLLRKIHDSTIDLLQNEQDIEGSTPSFAEDQALAGLPMWILSSHNDAYLATEGKGHKHRGNPGQPMDIAMSAASKIIENLAKSEGSRELGRVQELKDEVKEQRCWTTAEDVSV